MSLAAGTTVYEINGLDPVSGRGFVFTDVELNNALAEHVNPILWDDEGRADIAELLASVANTRFRQDRIDEILNQLPSLVDWRIGEAIAEAYLVEHHACEFPWPAGRDHKNPSSSAAGTDLVGFQRDSSGVRFAFGEVKTSEEARWPPRVVRSRHGLTRQLLNLRDSQSLKSELMLYLGYHRKDASWSDTYLEAATRYIDDPSDVSLFGYLVRDVNPRATDLSMQAEDMSNGCPPNTTIQLQAVYLPSNAIATLVARSKRARLGFLS